MQFDGLIGTCRYKIKQLITWIFFKIETCKRGEILLRSTNCPVELRRTINEPLQRPEIELLQCYLHAGLQLFVKIIDLFLNLFQVGWSEIRTRSIRINSLRPRTLDQPYSATFGIFSY